jgi:hypothetical protein
VVLAFTGTGIGEALADGLDIGPRWACNIAGCAVALWLIKVIGEIK